MSFTRLTTIYTGAAGQTLAAQLVDSTGSNVGSAQTTGFVDLGSGFYSWTYASFPDSFRGTVKFSVAGTVVAVAPFNPEEGENLDAKVSTRALAGAIVSITSPVTSTGDVTLVIGDDFYNADSRALIFTDTAGSWPDLTGATVAFTAYDVHDTELFTVAGTIVTASGSTKTVRFDISHTNTALLARGHNQRHAVAATLSDGHTVTLVQGFITGTEPGF